MTGSRSASGTLRQRGGRSSALRQPVGRAGGRTGTEVGTAGVARDGEFDIQLQGRREERWRRKPVQPRGERPGWIPDTLQAGYGSEEITGLPIEAGGTETVTLEVTPPRSAPAGRYPVVVEVSGGGASAAAELSIDVTGQPDIALTGPQERLSGDAVAGKKRAFLSRLQTPEAPRLGKLRSRRARRPAGKWSSKPERIDQIAPEGTSQVNVKITPSERAIAGDYMYPSAPTAARFRNRHSSAVHRRASTAWAWPGSASSQPRPLFLAWQ